MTTTKPPIQENVPNQVAKIPPRRPDGNLIVGDLFTFNKDRVGFFTDTGDIAPLVRFRMTYLDNLLVTDADFAKEILQTRNKNYVKEPRLMSILENGTSQVMFTADGDEWLWRRRLMQPAFHRKQVAQFCDAILDETKKHLADWQDGDRRDMDEEMKLVTMMIIGRTMFNVDMAGDSEELHEAYRTLGDNLVARIINPFHAPMWMPTQSNKEYKAVQKTVSQALTTIIEDRRKSQEPHNDLLDMLLAMADVEEGGFTENQLIYEMSSIVFAGHETTATTLTWLLYALSQHPEVEQQLHQELDTVLNGRQPTIDDLDNLPYLNQVINETLRYYPAAISTTRQAVEADVIGGYEIREKENIFINIRGIHFDKRYWDNPDIFDPDRFTPERSADRHKWAFIPFLNGPRKCIGEPLSRVEMQLILATMLQRFRFRLPEGTIVEEDLGFVLRPKGGLEMFVEVR